VKTKHTYTVNNQKVDQGFLDNTPELTNFTDKGIAFLAELEAEKHMDRLAFLAVPFEEEDLTPLQGRLDHIQNNFSDVVILGTGGSSLGAQALISLNTNGFRSNKFYPNLHFPDNLSPHTMSELFQSLDLGKTHFLVISKSGGTAETLAQFFVSLEAVENEIVSHQVTNHFTIIVEPGTSSLRNLATKRKFEIIDHPPKLGGRFSVLSVVGLLPALISGIDIHSIRKGARNCLDHLFTERDPLRNEAIMGAALSCFLNKTYNISISFMMPYDSRLVNFSRWHQQLWAESLGKDGKGLTPVRAVGPLDQHSQLQLLLEGPNDKFITILTEDIAGKGPTINLPDGAGKNLKYLEGKSIGDLVQAEALSTLDVLKSGSRPIRHISFDNLTPDIMGELLMFFMIETALTAHLLGVNAYDQPAVEQGKLLTRKYLKK
jgi:glucose-6-phosphate isomerase